MSLPPDPIARDTLDSGGTKPKSPIRHLLPVPLTTRVCSPWVIVILLLIVLALGVSPAYRAFESWRADTLIEKAAAAAAAGDSVTQIRSLRLAFQITPWKPETIRSQAKYYLHEQPPKSLAYFETLVSEGNATADDKQLFLEAALASGDPSAARKALALSPLQDDLKQMQSWARVLIAEGDWSAALWKARSAVEGLTDGPDRETAKRFLAQILVGYPAEDVEVRMQYNEEIVQLLGDLCRTEGGSATEAMKELLAIEANPPQAWTSPSWIGELPERLYTHPSADFQAKLAAARFVLRRKGKEDPLAQSWLHDLVAEAASETALDLLVTWLTEAEAYDLLIRYIPWERVSRHPNGAFGYLLALAKTDRWKELQEYADPKVDSMLAPTLRLALTALAVQSTKDREAARPIWESATQSLSNPDPTLVDRMTMLATMGGQDWVSLRALRKLSEAPEHYMEASERLVRYFREQGDTSGIRTVYADLARRSPADAATETSLIYYSLLLRKDVPESAAKADTLLRDACTKATITSPVNQSTLNGLKVNTALAALRQQQPAGAEAALVNFRILRESPPSHLVVYAAAMAEAGQKESANHILRSIPPGTLLPEEKQLANDAIRLINPAQ